MVARAHHLVLLKAPGMHQRKVPVMVPGIDVRMALVMALGVDATTAMAMAPKMGCLMVLKWAYVTVLSSARLRVDLWWESLSVHGLVLCLAWMLWVTWLKGGAHILQLHLMPRHIGNSS